MRRKRGELVPIGEVVSGLDDKLVPAIRNDSPQARHHFTLADQVNGVPTVTVQNRTLRTLLQSEVREGS